MHGDRVRHIAVVALFKSARVASKEATDNNSNAMDPALFAIGNSDI
jgi:hypothetical protein